MQAEQQSAWEMPSEPELFAFINRTPLLASLLYDINLLPEQVPDGRRWGYMLAVCEHMRAALSHPSTPQGWQDIESAPKDGTNVLLRDRGGHHADGYWLRSAYNGNGAWIWPFIHANPTHWQHLPPPPEQGSKG